MTFLQKQQIVEFITEAVTHLGSQKAVANKCQVSSALVSQMVNQNWDNIADSTWASCGAALGWKPTDDWQFVETYDVRLMDTIMMDAKQQSMFLSFAHPAGGGKTTGSTLFARRYANQAVYRIHCQEWSDRQFMIELCRELGIEQPRGYASVADLRSLVIKFFLARQNMKPLLLIDEADKLKPAALRTLIPIYNATEDRMGVVMMGTNNLEKTINLGVRYDKRGFDEIDSRFGRKYIKLRGADQKEVNEICMANGITDAAHQRRIWEECTPVEIKFGDRFLKVIKDLRRLKRVIKRDKINQAVTA